MAPRGRRRDGDRRGLAAGTAALALLLALAPLLGACEEDEPAGPTADDGPLRVLFIGNSLTAAHDLPLLVRIVAEAAGEAVTTEAAVQGGGSLEDHWRLGLAPRRIRESPWDVVVLQQGPSSLPENQVHLREWSERYAPLIRESGGRPALYMVWPSEARSHAFDAVSESYTNAAEAVDGMLFPVGEAWRIAWSIDPTIELYGSDRFHPTRTASILAALVIYGRLFDRSPEALPPRLEPTTPGLPAIDVEPGAFRVLREAAARANREFGR